MAIRIAINGFGRIGRLAFRQLMEMEEYNIVAINDPAAAELSAYLLKFDTTQGTYTHGDTVTYTETSITVCGKEISYYREVSAEKLPWGALDIDLVVDCSGAYRSKEKAQKHIDAGAKKVMISAPAGTDVPTVVYGVNHHILKGSETIISAASCSTNALAPMVQYLHECAPILSGMMLVIHGYTSTQMLQDNAQKTGNIRRSRAAAENIIPTTAEAAAAVGRVIPELNGRLVGSAVRVPIPAGCLITLTAVVEGTDLSADKINASMKSHQSKIFGYAVDEYVSSDIIGNTYASIFDPTQTLVSQTKENEYVVRVAAWFDNENSFVSQMVRLIRYSSTPPAYLP